MVSDLRCPVRVSLVIYAVHRRALWNLRAHAGMASTSHVLRRLIRDTAPATLNHMATHFAAPNVVARGTLGRLSRPSILLDACDLDHLDLLTRLAKAPSRSAATRFLIESALGSLPPRTERSALDPSRQPDVRGPFFAQ